MLSRYRSFCLALSLSLHNGIGPETGRLDPLSLSARRRHERSAMPSKMDAGETTMPVYGTHPPTPRTIACFPCCTLPLPSPPFVDLGIPDSLGRRTSSTAIRVACFLLLLEQIRGFQPGWKPRLLETLFYACTASPIPILGGPRFTLK